MHTTLGTFIMHIIKLYFQYISAFVQQLSGLLDGFVYWPGYAYNGGLLSPCYSAIGPLALSGLIETPPIGY